MRKRKERKGVDNPGETLKSKSKTLNPNPIKQEEEEIEEKGKKGNGFFACYLLTSLSPRHKGHTYIGFTVNPRRRIRQHNGEIRCGAWRTKSRRPWEMVLCIYGFPTNVSALQFEWAWQHPMESLAVRQAAATFKSFSGVANKIKLAFTMLNLPNWQSLNITVNYFSTKYSSHSAGCPSLPEHMKVQVCAMDELRCYSGSDDSILEDEDSLGYEDHVEVGDRIGSLEETCTNASIDISADYPHILDDAPLEQFKNEQPRVSSSLEVDCQQAFDLIDSLAGTTSSVVTTSPSMGFVHESIEELGWQRSEQMTCVVIADEDRQPWPREKQSTNAEVGNKDQERIQSCTVSQDIELIDLLTPSPNCRDMSWSKKRKVSSVSPVIIDLT
ncbi:hypothetical protein LWI29_012993 [Acer saccharum]|uniref:Structure-specific endonuclease subunit SLX1 homolog n=1 Tax=Acer saccharum TaxID=4024 RepID=A0AA39SMV1_ACESA|nr:hypothetical protein LWI29_012993 [Acer saccharum]